LFAEWHTYGLLTNTVSFITLLKHTQKLTHSVWRGIITLMVYYSITQYWLLLLLLLLFNNNAQVILVSLGRN